VNRHLKSLVSLFTCFCVMGAASASSANIGVVMTTGEVQVDGTSVPGTSAIFAGSSISSIDRTSNLSFSDGTSATMRPGTTMTVFRERSVLQQGVTIQSGVDRHPVLAGELKISGSSSNASVLVGVKDSSHIEVSAQEGQSEVRSSGGTLLARLEPGTALSFQVTQQPAKEEEKHTSICGDVDKQYQITGSKNGVNYQLKETAQVTDLSPYVNYSVRVKGLLVTTSPDPQILKVLEIKKLDRPCEGAGIIPAAGNRGIALLVFIAAGGALLGYGALGGFGTSPNPVTPAIP
jgi:hypothetical protein